jgi:hypothetical protein
MCQKFKIRQRKEINCHLLGVSCLANFKFLTDLNLKQPWATCGPRAACGPLSYLERPFKIFRAALLKPLKNGYFTEKSTKCIVKVYTLALDMTF